MKNFKYYLNRETGEYGFIKTEHKKRLRLRKWVKVALVILALLIAILIIKKLDDDFIKNCVNNGYSYDYCMAHR